MTVLRLWIALVLAGAPALAGACAAAAAAPQHEPGSSAARWRRGARPAHGFLDIDLGPGGRGECGGTLSACWFITAAHCVTDTDDPLRPVHPLAALRVGLGTPSAARSRSTASARWSCTRAGRATRASATTLRCCGSRAPRPIARCARAEADKRHPAPASAQARRRVPANLVARRPRITGARLVASGTLAKLARGIVHLELVFVSGGAAAHAGARRHDRERPVDERLDQSVRTLIAARRGAVHSYTLFTGDLPARMRGELRSLQVLGSR